jgi:hypothetical protein
VFLRACPAHHRAARPRLALTRGSRHVSGGPSIHSGARFRVLQGRVAGHQHRGAVLHEADPGMTMAVQAARMALGRCAPAVQVAVLRRHGRCLAPTTATGRTAGPHAPHGVPGRIVAVVAQRLPPLTRRLTVRPRAAGRITGLRDGPSIRSSVAQRLGRVRDGAQPSGASAGHPPEVRVRRPPVCASRGRGSAAGTSPQAAAMRRPGGCRGPP